ncbi:MAG: hypothetical protein M3Q68_04695, partial [Actinomycetota bacterium]|nr:hypothetical protein [Actinomycetota bacterium]
MRSDIDEPDLYPPDAEELTPDAKQHRNRAAIGTALVVWGTSLLVHRALGIDLETFFLGIGLGALAGWSQHRRYVWFLVGSISTAIGIGDVITGPFDNAFGSTISLLLIAAGFGAVYARYPRRSPWAVPVAAVFVLIGVGSFGIALIGLVPAVLGRFLLPMLLIGGGGLLLARHSLPPKAVKAGLAALAVTFVLVGATSVPDIDRDPIDLGGGPGRTTSFEAPLPAVAGRTLELRAGSGNVELRRTSGPDGLVRALGAHGARHLDIEDGKNIVIDGGRASGLFAGHDEVRDYVLELPDGVILDIELESGSITGMVGGGSGSLRT